VQEGWTQKGGHPKEDDEAGPASWEGWESRLKEERVPGYVVAEIFGKVSDEIRATYAEATQPFEVLSTLSVGQEPSTEPMAAAAMPASAIDPMLAENLDPSLVRHRHARSRRPSLRYPAPDARLLPAPVSRHGRIY